jgi:hypothetical protein
VHRQPGRGGPTTVCLWVGRVLEQTLQPRMDMPRLSSASNAPAGREARREGSGWTNGRPTQVRRDSPGEQCCTIIQTFVENSASNPLQIAGPSCQILPVFLQKTWSHAGRRRHAWPDAGHPIDPASLLQSTLQDPQCRGMPKFDGLMHQNHCREAGAVSSGRTLGARPHATATSLLLSHHCNDAQKLHKKFGVQNPAMCEAAPELEVH